MTASPNTVRTALLASGAMLVCVVPAFAEDASAPGPQAEITSVRAESADVSSTAVAPAAAGVVSFHDPEAALTSATPAPALELGVSRGQEMRFAPSAFEPSTGAGPRRIELELAASGERTGIGLDIAVAQRASFGADENGDVDRQGRGSELRLGDGLGGEREPSERPTWYVFAASEDEALTWQPGAQNGFGGNGNSFALQDRVEIGDMQAGITYERGPMQASIAYVEREVSTRTYGQQSISQDESFTGFTLTMKR